MEKAFVAQRVATKLFTTEAAVDAAMIEATELMADMLKARTDVGTSLVFADDVQVKMVEAIKALGEARTAMVGVHTELTEAMFNDLGRCADVHDRQLNGGLGNNGF